MRRGFVLLVLLYAAFGRPPGLSGESAAEQLRRIQELRLDPEACYRVRDLFLERDDAKLYFTDGYLLFAQPFEGRDIAAFFVAKDPADEGEILVIPPTRRERRSLALFTSQPVLNEKFRTAMMFFTDDTAAVLRAGLANSSFSRREPKTGAVLAENWTPVLRNVLEALAVRILMDVASGLDPRSGFFAAAAGGGPRGRFDVVNDPRLDESLSVGQVVWRDNERFYEIWCRFPGRRFREGRLEKVESSGWLEDYHIESRLSPDLNMRVIAKATFVPDGADERLITFELSRRLLLTKLLLNGEPVEFLQFEQPAASGAQQRQNNLVAMALPESPSPGSRHAIEFHYEGRVVSDAGGGVYYVGSRGSWYPRRELRFTNFELLFHHPESLNLVATGELVETSAQEGVRTSLFRTPSPIRLAGFNLGHYVTASKKVGDYTVEVCANKGVETQLQPRKAPPIVWMDPLPNRRRRHPGSSSPAIVTPAPQPEVPRPADRIEAVARHSAEALQFFVDRFGPPPVSKIVISPIPGGFGQGFPGLVYASTLSYFSPEDTPLKQYPEPQQLFYSELLRTHEIAHQWWGNVVTNDSPSDVWLMEALATYSALLFLEDRFGKQALDDQLRSYKEGLLERNEAGETIESAGAIVLGERLRSSRFPHADRKIVYEKGAWIIHMLRGIMGDDNFFAFLSRLCKDYRLQTLTTEDFRKEAARFAPSGWPDSSLTSFFEQWVYGTGVPQLKMTYDVNGKSPAYRFAGRLLQEGVPDYFSSAVPVEIHTTPGRSLLKWIHTEGPVTEFSVVLRNKPSRAVIDPGNVVLLTRQP